MVEMSAAEKRNYSNRVTLMGSFVDALLGILKVTVGIMSQSQALIVDGLHSFSDLFTDIFVIFINRYSHDDPDDEHPYGHQRIETLGTLAMGSTLLLVAGAFAYENIIKIVRGESDVNLTWMSFVVASLSVILKEIVFHFIKNAAKKLNSPLLLASAWHSRTDAFSSVVVIIGFIFTSYGYFWFDSIAAIIVAILIGRIGWNFMKESLVELSDTSLANERVNQYRKCIMSVDGVLDAHNLRSRRMGPKAILDVNVQVHQKITASEGHEISTWVAKKLIDQFEEVIDVTVHTDVEDDLTVQYSNRGAELLPLRSDVLKELEKVWGEFNIIPKTNSIRLHYVDNKITIEFIINLEKDEQPMPKEKLDKLNNLASTKPWFNKIDVLYRCHSR